MRPGIVGYSDAEAEQLLQGWRERLEPRLPAPCPTDDYRLRDRLGRLEPRNILADAILPLRQWAPPGLFARVVPPQHLLAALGRDGRDYMLVLCPCGAESVLERYTFTECVGDCGRWFLSARGEIRVHRFELDDVDTLEPV